MLISKPILAILFGLVVFMMVAEAVVVARVTKAFAVHEYHGILNGKVGHPYERLIEELVARHDAGDTEALGRALKAADDQSRELYDVWLLETRRNAYRDSVDAILK